MDEIKKCPFCGSEADSIQDDEGWWDVICEQCEAKMPGGFEKHEAIERWNERVDG